MEKHGQRADSAAPRLPGAKIKLTERFIASRKAAAAGRRDDYHDSLAPGLALRVTDKGHKSFVLHARFPQNPTIFTRRLLGSYPAASLERARKKARAWQELMALGKDPGLEERRQRLAEARQAKVTLSAVVEDFIREKLPSERKGADVARDLRRDLLPRMGDLPISSVERIDIRDLIKEKKASAPAQARNLLGYIKRVFAWAVAQEIYGLQSSPCSEIRAREIIGDRNVGERNLSDSERFALWRAAGREPYPYQEIYQLLMLTALRLNEVADASLGEFDFAKRDWTIPATRMKGRNATARAHLVPLSRCALEIIGTLPNLSEGPYLFSSTFGRTPIWVGSRVKDRLDARMLRTLKALARLRGENPNAVRLEPWTNHDIRRTVRTNLSPLKNGYGVRVADEVKEAILAHKRPGIKGVYDKYEYADEKFEALELWAQRLDQITKPARAPTPSNVVLLRRVKP